MADKMLRRVPARLSQVWMPSGGIAIAVDEDAHGKLVRGGFLRQAHAGIFHMLPLGRRVQDKIERLIEKHMEEALGASRVALSTISSEDLWRKSGRLSQIGAELFRFSDRKNASFLLSPTHEEEITSLVARTINSYKDLPLRLYQITRKYRDEARPRYGLLRGREFTMKDLYTFDISVPAALKTYDLVRDAYARIFQEMKLPILVAKASSGDMGGDLSHEYHLPSSLGEDHVVRCDKCDYVINDELAEARATDQQDTASPLGVWRGITKDRSTLVNVWYPTRTVPTQPVDSATKPNTYTDDDVNVYAVKSLIPDLDASIEDPLAFWQEPSASPENSDTPKTGSRKIVNLVDSRVKVEEFPSVWPKGLSPPSTPLREEFLFGKPNKPLNLLRIRSGVSCSQCEDGTLHVQKAIELGHTFHLGTRYSKPLNAQVPVPADVLSHWEKGAPTGGGEDVFMQMGCHGIGISRIIAAVADHLADDKGLNWPAAIAPYRCIVVPAEPGYVEDGARLAQQLARDVRTTDEPLDILLDDRNKRLGWKLKDADLVGFPLIIVLGRDWKDKRVEVQCRRLGVKASFDVTRLAAEVEALLEKL